MVWHEYYRWEWLFFDGAILAFCIWQLISLRRLKRRGVSRASSDAPRKPDDDPPA
ncbi:MAG TPA: hypothetical protein VFG38_10545 [Pseudomonadales bacterium]|nr:hypothetical protein [Pseudomonadales bacterium]